MQTFPHCVKLCPITLEPHGLCLTKPIIVYNRQHFSSWDQPVGTRIPAEQVLQRLLHGHGLTIIALNWETWWKFLCSKVFPSSAGFINYPSPWQFLQIPSCTYRHRRKCCAVSPWPQTSIAACTQDRQRGRSWWHRGSFVALKQTYSAERCSGTRILDRVSRVACQ